MPFDTPDAPNGRHFRTLFISDLHLGALGSRSDLILDFLNARSAEKYVLVGDVLDLWQPLLPHWTPCDQAVIDHLRRRKHEGAEISYVLGNHDPAPQHAPAHARLDVDPKSALVHVAVNGRRYLIIHGDIADNRLLRSHLVTRFGSLLDHVLRRLDHSLRRLRRSSHGEARSVTEALLSSLNAMSYAGRGHEQVLVDMARAAGLDGVICGHFHISTLHDDLGLTYANCGDWVDSFTALVERHDGSLQLLGGRTALAASQKPLGALADA